MPTTTIPEGPVRGFHKLPHRRAGYDIYTCVAPEDTFGPVYEDLPQEVRAVIDQLTFQHVQKRTGLGCDGGGVLGEWCADGRGLLDGTLFNGCPWMRWLSQLTPEQLIQYQALRRVHLD